MEACPEGHCTEAIATPEVFAKDPEFVPGTSGLVYPAAGFADIAHRHDTETLEFNLADTEQSSLFDHHITSKADETVPAYVNSLIASS